VNDVDDKRKKKTRGTHEVAKAAEANRLSAVPFRIMSIVYTPRAYA
jgi:hypothetical protein